MTSESAIVPGGRETLDWIILAGYLAATVLLGASFYRGQNTTWDFFLAGRSMAWMPVGLSLIATLFSANSYMALPSVTQENGLIFFVGPFVILLCMPIVNRIFLPYLQPFAALQRLRIPGAPFRRPGPLPGQRALHPLARNLATQVKWR